MVPLGTIDGAPKNIIKGLCGPNWFSKEPLKGKLHKMVMSIGWNPYYKNTKKSMETHVIHNYKEDFYGEVLSVVMVGYIREEKSFSSLEALRAAINSDIEEAKVKLELPEHLKLREDNFFTSVHSSSSTQSATNTSTPHSIMNGH
ncbi:riboflavin kinase-like [Thalassophryne amazonica]|uniref:riboflavin kinase-like n=1 Tax=Thalassophryne amazonica TaxID=390379 RepID=UPI00147183BF|nr:riboflavin kinase-like [Thalassophryne amazonica]